MVGLYIAPNQSSGIINGCFDGPAFRGISMWGGWGDVWIEEKEQNINIDPSDLVNKVNYHFIEASLYGKFTQGENYAMGLGLGQTLFINNMNWGIYYILFGSEDYYNTTQFEDFQGKIGGMGYFGSEGIGFWLADIYSDWSSPDWAPQAKIIYGGVAGGYLTLQGEGNIYGNLLGSYDDNGWWQAELLGIWEADKDRRFMFSSWIGDYIYLYDGEWKKIGEIEGIMGGECNLNNPSWLLFLGKYYIKESAGNFKYSLISSDIRNYSTDNTDLYRGFFTGIIGLTPDTNLVEGNIYCLYKDPTTNLPGILVGDFSGSSYFHIGMWEADGGISPVKELSSSWPTGLGLDDITPNIHSNLTVSSDGDIWVSQYDTYSLGISGEPWYIWMDKITGSYSGSPSDNWISYVYYNFDTPDISKDTWEHVLSGISWEDNIVEADVAGAWVSWQDAVTGVSGGKLIGTFDPSNLNWQAVASGVSMTTEKFLQMVQNGEIDKLQQLNIPCFEIGKTTLTGSNGNISVTMQDVIFFARQSGGVPRIWATDKVSGSFTTQPNINDSVSLQSQSGDTAQFNNVQFKIINWQNSTSTWGAIVESTNAGTVGSYSNIHMKGAAAGTFGGGNFSGTASGIAKQQ